MARQKNRTMHRFKEKNYFFLVHLTTEKCGTKLKSFAQKQIK